MSPQTIYIETLLNLWFLYSLNSLLCHGYVQDLHRSLNRLLHEYNDLHAIALTGDLQLFRLGLSLSDSL